MKHKAAWDPEYHRLFVDICVEQKMVGNKPGTQHIMEPFQQRVGAKFNKKQLKNHWDTMCKQWKIWRRLIQSSEMKWDPETNTFGASDEDWANYLQVNPDAGPYRLNPPMYLKKLEIIFEGSNIDGGEDEGGSSQSKRMRLIKLDDEEEEEEADTGDDRQSASNTTHSKGYWPPVAHDLFLDLLVQETQKGNRPDTHYPKDSWRMMLDTINQTTGRNYTRAQLKNHWDCTRKSWKIWCQCLGASIMKWDPNTRTFGATDEDWKTYLQENPRAVQFRRKHILHADKLATIFEGVIEPGKAYFRPYRKRSRDLTELHNPTPLSTHYNVPVMGSEDGVGVGDDADDEEDDDDDDVTPPPIRRRFNSAGFAGESRLQDVQIVAPPPPPPMLHRFNIEALKDSVTKNEKEYEYSIGECIECLDEMEEVEEGCDLYMFALDLFLKREYREIFLQLKKSSLRMSWLLRLQSAAPTIAAA